MERAAPVRSSHTSTADLLAWPQPQGPAPATPSPPRRPGQVTAAPPSSLSSFSLHAYLHLPPPSPDACRFWLTKLASLRFAQPSEAIRKVVFGGQVTEEEADSLTKRSDSLPLQIPASSLALDRALARDPSIRVKGFVHLDWYDAHLDDRSSRKPCSAPKWKEMTGSGIFAAGSNGDAGEAAAAAKPARTSSRQVTKSVQTFYLYRHFCLIVCVCVLNWCLDALGFTCHTGCNVSRTCYAYAGHIPLFHAEFHNEINEAYLSHWVSICWVQYALLVHVQ
jgi:hypothetical protein